MPAGPRQFGEPHINGAKATPYNTWHQNWQSRIAKEQMGALSQDAVHALVAAPPQGRSDSTWHLCGKGVAHERNNSSSALSRCFGPKHWAASGSFRTEQRDLAGDPNPHQANKVNAFRTFSGMAVSSMKQSSSMPVLPRPGNQTVAAMQMRAMPNRSVASVLRKPDTPPTPSLASAPPAPLEGEQGVLGVDAYRRPQNASISAEVMRAAPNRSIASVLRHARANQDGPSS